jgi:MFS transporter, DHA2 family, multidrug resistance protein
VDWLGVLSSSAGLAALTYGIIRAGDDGWGDRWALTALGLGVAVLVGFVAWEARLRGRSGTEPLVDLGLFRSASFTWGTVLAGVGIFAMIGVLFTAPQYFQAVLGTDAMGSGVRLLPLIGGVVLGGGTADRVATTVGPKLAAATGFAVLAGGLAWGATTGPHTGFGVVAGWTALVGLGMGWALATTAAAALGELSADRAGVGSAVMQTVQKVGAPFGAAILGSVLNAGYRDGVSGPARDSVFAGIAAAQKLNSAALLETVRAAFAHGMDDMLWVCGGIAVAGTVLALVFLPTRKAVPRQPAERERVHVG